MNQPQKRLRSLNARRNVNLDRSVNDLYFFYTNLTNDLVVGDRLSEIQHYIVTEKKDNEAVLRNERGFEYRAQASIIEEGMDSANQFTQTQRISRTALVGILESTAGCVFTVNFNKQPTAEGNLERLNKAMENNFETLKNPAARAELAANLILGEDRTIRGVLDRTEQKLGRTRVFDQDVPDENNQRLVDHRTVNWMIYKNIKYIVQ